jgi:hypothetical protein
VYNWVRLCTQARRNFTLELPLYSPSEIAEHQAGHPRCNFCRQHFYSSDELFTHMRARHFGCQVCQRAGGEFSYFENADSLIDHLRCANIRHQCQLTSVESRPDGSLLFVFALRGALLCWCTVSCLVFQLQAACRMQNHTCEKLSSSQACTHRHMAWVWLPIFGLKHVFVPQCRRSHHLCEEPDCQGALMAYATEEELAQHRRDRHSRVMPRWQRDIARRVDVDFDVRRRPGTASGPGHGNPQQRACGYMHSACIDYLWCVGWSQLCPCWPHAGDNAWHRWS